MKIKNYLLISALVTAMLSGSAFCQTVPLLPEEQKPALIARRHPELIGIKALYFNIVIPEAEAKQHASAFNRLKTRAQSMLEDAGIDVIPQIHDRIAITSPELRVNIDMLKLNGSQQYVVHIQTFFSRAVFLKYRPSLGLKAEVWKTDAVMRLVPTRDMHSALTDVIFGQVDAFIFAHRLAKVSTGKLPPTDSIPIPPTEYIKPTVGTVIAEHKFVASKNSAVFHKPDCHWVEQISLKNLIGYNTRQEALDAGKRPCKRCKP